MAEKKKDNINTGAEIATGNKDMTEKKSIKELLAEEKKLNEEYVTIQLLKDNGKYKDDVYVAINGENCVIKRGVPVRIKRKFALLLAQSQEEDQRTAAKIALLAQQK